MATYGQTIRRGLPRLPGGDPWPPAGVALAAPDAAAAVAEPVDVAVAEPVDVAVAEPVTSLAEPVAAPSVVPAAVPAGSPAPGVAGDGERRIRRGLPRVPGGEPWPPSGSAPVVAPVAGAAATGAGIIAPAAAATEAPASAVVAPAAGVTATPPSAEGLAPAAAATEAAASTAPAPPAEPAAGAPALRRGLPRVAGGEPWPPAGFAPTVAAGAATAPVAGETTETAVAGPLAPPDASSREAEAPSAVVAVRAVTDLSAPLPFTRTVFPGRAAVAFERERLSGERTTTPEPARIGPFTRVQWLGAAIVVGGGLLLAAGMAVVAVRFLLSLPPFQEFLVAYPGEYPLPEGAPVGIPPWLGWQHFFNTFLIVLIIRSGLQVRTEKRPSVFWSPRGNARRKISLNLWFHQSLDILWVTNGVIYVVLLFATGQWMKIVPTSWEVFPNALSAALQYVSLDWPTENGWVNYNSLQQLAYFATVFIAAPLAIATGVRMSGIWPKNATALNRAYPVEWARRVHFPVMLYFVAFIFVHVALVLATNALRNLNHMYASQDAINWVGFVIFAASLLVIAAGWVAARPLVLAPIARLFGSVSGR